MIGDTNLFLSLDDDDTSNLNGEAEIMIAEMAARNKGMGKEAMLLMFKYGTSLGIAKFIAKIGYDNIKSQQLFHNFQFTETTRSEIFREITYERIVNANWLDWLDNAVTLYQIDNYRTF